MDTSVRVTRGMTWGRKGCGPRGAIGDTDSRSTSGPDPAAEDIRIVTMSVPESKQSWMSGSQVEPSLPHMFRAIIPLLDCPGGFIRLLEHCRMEDVVRMPDFGPDPANVSESTSGGLGGGRPTTQVSPIRACASRFRSSWLINNSGGWSRSSSHVSLLWKVHSVMSWDSLLKACSGVVKLDIEKL